MQKIAMDKQVEEKKSYYVSAVKSIYRRVLSI